MQSVQCQHYLQFLIQCLYEEMLCCKGRDIWGDSKLPIKEPVVMDALEKALQVTREVQLRPV